MISLCATIGGFAEAAFLVVIARLAFALASDFTFVTVSLGPLGERSLSMWTLIAIASGLVALRITLQVVQSRLASVTVARVYSRTRARLARTFLGASWALQSGERAGRLQEMVGGFSATAANAVMVLATGIVALASLATFLLTALAVSVIAAVVVGLTAGVLSLLLRPLRTVIRRAYRELAVENLGLSTEVTDTANHVLELRVFGVEREVADRLVGGMTSVARLDAKSRFLSALAPIVYQGTAFVLLLGVIAVLYATETTSLGAVGGVVLIMVRSLTYGQSLLNAYQSLHSTGPQLEMLRDEVDRFEAAAVRAAAIRSIGSGGSNSTACPSSTSPTCRCSTTCRSPSRRVRSWGSWARRAQGSRRSCSCCCACASPLPVWCAPTGATYASCRSTAGTGT